MRKNISLIVFCLLIISCISTKKSLNLKKVEKGEQLEYAQEISVDQFFEIWMHNRISMLDINCRVLYKDSNYVYFGKNTSKFLSLVPSLYKVNKDTLTLRLGDFNKIDAQRIRNEFWDIVVPRSDRVMFEMPLVCKNSGSLYRQYNYRLKGKKIFINLDLKIECVKRVLFGHAHEKEVIFEKTFIGYYDISLMKIVAE